MRALVGQEGDIVKMRNQAARDGLKSLRLSGAQKIANGQTTMDEVLKAAPPFTT
jgi:general secretion pathway protein E